MEQLVFSSSGGDGLTNRSPVFAKRADYMGAWDVDRFDNDAACDWAYELEGTSDLSCVRETFDAVLEVGDGYPDSDEACMALAACEVLARPKGSFGKRDAYTKTVDKWVDAHPQTPPADLIETALSVIDRIRTQPSELIELWEQTDASEWHAAVDNLRKRVAT